MPPYRLEKLIILEGPF